MADLGTVICSECGTHNPDNYESCGNCFSKLTGSNFCSNPGNKD